MREKTVHRWVIVLLFTVLVGIGNLGISGEVVAGGSFEVPEVNEHFDQVKPGPQTQKPEPVTQPVQEKRGAFDWLTDPISKAYNWTADKASAALNWIKETASSVWDWIVDVISKITEVTVDALTAAWNWILEHKEYVVGILSIVGVIVAVIGFVFEASLALLIGVSILVGELISGLFSWILGNELFSDEMLFDMLVGGITGGISALFGWVAGIGVAGSSVVRWLGTKIPWVGRIFPKMFGGGVMAGVDQSLWDLLKNGKINWIRTVIATGVGFVLVFGGETLGSHSDELIKWINRIDISPVTQYFADGTTTAPKFIGDTPLGEWLQKFANNGQTGNKQKLVPGTPEHKAQRWKEYQEDGGEWNYERWSKAYDLNMKRAKNANEAMDNFHKKLGWGQREVTVMADGHVRRMDIADKALRKGIEHKTRAVLEGKGYFSLSQEIKWEIQRDRYLVQEQNWDITWVFENADASQPLLDELRKSGIKVEFIRKGGSIKNEK